MDLEPILARDSTERPKAGQPQGWGECLSVVEVGTLAEALRYQPRLEPSNLAALAALDFKDIAGRDS
jgi:hypothetical protein